MPGTIISLHLFTVSSLSVSEEYIFLIWHRSPIDTEYQQITTAKVLEPEKAGWYWIMSKFCKTASVLVIVFT